MPDADTRAYRDSHLHKGAQYHEKFRTNALRAAMWRLEKRAILASVDELLRDGVGAYLDFACGTGRLLGLLSGRVNVAFGLDVSTEMLRIARKEARSAHLIRGDQRTVSAFGRGRFDLITAFRFFANAEPHLRQSAMRSLAGALSDSGLFVFNNHKNASSIRFRMQALLGSGAKVVLSESEVRSLVEDAGLTVVHKVGLGVLPATDSHPILPHRILTGVESVLSRIPRSTTLHQNVIFVCQKRC